VLAIRMAMKRRLLACRLLAIVGSLAACGGDDEQAAAERTAAPERTTAPQAKADETLVIRLKQQNRFTTTGTATIKGGDRGYSVRLAVKPKDDHMAHIHNVTCAEYRATKGFDAQLATVDEPLTDVEKGRSETSIEAPLSSVRTGGFSINVHSYEGGFPAVACAHIPAG
jgi:hypothetical protein